MRTSTSTGTIPEPEDLRETALGQSPELGPEGTPVSPAPELQSVRPPRGTPRGSPSRSSTQAWSAPELGHSRSSRAWPPPALGKTAEAPAQGAGGGGAPLARPAMPLVPGQEPHLQPARPQSPPSPTLNPILFSFCLCLPRTHSLLYFSRNIYLK